MNTAIFSVHTFEKEFLLDLNSDRHDLIFLDATLDINTAVLDKGYQAVSIFVH